MYAFFFICFSGDNVDCWMEIQQGKGPWASPVNGIVPLGTTLTMVVGIDDKEGKHAFQKQILAVLKRPDLNTFIIYEVSVQT